MQTSYQDQSALPALEGGLYDPGFDQYVESATPGGNTAQVADLNLTTTIAAVAAVKKLTITTAADADAYTITIGEFTFTGTSSGTDKTVQRNAILAQLDANTAFKALYDTASVSTDALEVTSKRVGTDVIVPATVVIQATSVWDWTTTTANVIGTQVLLTLDGYEFRYQFASTAEETERDALLAALLLDDFFTARVTMVANDDADPVFGITFTAVEAGVPFTLTYSNVNHVGQAGSGTAALVQTTANVTGDPIPFGRVVRRTGEQTVALPSVTGQTFEGMSVNRAKARPRVNFDTGDAEYRGDEPVPVLRKGRMWVRPETTGALTATVYVRHTQGAATTATQGRVRATDDTGKVDAWSAARWVTTPVAGELCVLEFNLP